MMFGLVKILLLFPLVLSTVQCNEDKVGDRTVTVKSEKLTWTEAQETCKNEGKHLVTVASGEENIDLVNIMEVYDMTHSWIGAHFTGGAWKWNNATAAIEKFFTKPVLVAEAGHNCIVVNVVEGLHTNWEYSDCETNYSFICE